MRSRHCSHGVLRRAESVVVRCERQQEGRNETKEITDDTAARKASNAGMYVRHVHR